MKILILTIKKGLQGGVEAATSDIYKELSRNEKCDFSFLNYGGESDSEWRILKPFFRFFDLFFLAARIIKFKPDLIHIDTSLNKMTVWRDAPTVVLAKIFKSNLFLWMHGTNATSAYSSKATTLLTGFVIRKSNLIGLMSDDEIRFFQKRYPVIMGKFVKVTPGINISKMRKKTKTSNPNKKQIILFISRLIEDKGPFETIRAYIFAKAKLSNSELWIAGAGPAEKKLRILARDPSIKFLGHVRGDNRLYKNSDMLVLPTYHNEGMPMTIVKALVFGLPIVTTQIRGIKDNLKDPENCLFVQPRDVKNLTKKMVLLAQNELLRQRMKKNNLRLAKRFEAKYSAKKLLEIYEKCLKP